MDEGNRQSLHALYPIAIIVSWLSCEREESKCLNVLERGSGCNLAIGPSGGARSRPPPLSPLFSSPESPSRISGLPTARASFLREAGVGLAREMAAQGVKMRAKGGGWAVEGRRDRWRRLRLRQKMESLTFSRFSSSWDVSGPDFRPTELISTENGCLGSGICVLASSFRESRGWRNFLVVIAASCDNYDIPYCGKLISALAF